MKLMKQVEYVVENEDQVDSWQEVTLVYSAALKQINTKLEILNDEFQHVHRYNPIEHIKSRMKTSESIVKKLKRYGYESTIENMVSISTTLREYALSALLRLIFTALLI